MNTIYIGWDGPFTMKEVNTMNQPHDYGIYQVYGPHPTYCRVELLYIGMAPKQTFGVRIPNHNKWIEYTRDSSQASIYVGRLMGDETPENVLWERQIELAESILIHAHYPTYNSQKDSAISKPEFGELRVFNLGRHRDLLPEISGARLGINERALKPYGSPEMEANNFLKPVVSAPDIIVANSNLPQ
jgi:hypothetical protein